MASVSARNGIETARAEMAPMRSAKAKPRAKPATITAVTRAKTNGESQDPVATTATTWNDTSTSSRTTLLVSLWYRKGWTMRKTL
ncbi:hypothetical protein BH23ACT2_BH23ACT2_17270 [soil metagenome]